MFSQTHLKCHPPYPPNNWDFFLEVFFCFSCVNLTTYFCKLFGKIHQIICIKKWRKKLYLTMILLLLLLLSSSSLSQGPLSVSGNLGCSQVVGGIPKMMGLG